MGKVFHTEDQEYVPTLIILLLVHCKERESEREESWTRALRSSQTHTTQCKVAIHQMPVNVPFCVLCFVSVCSLCVNDMTDHTFVKVS